jgi:hypothetical protein
VPITWEVFKRELLVRFGPTEVEDYDEALTKIKQTGTLREYQQEFERLANRVEGWRQKALVGAFLGGLKSGIVSAVRMFKSKTLRDAIKLAPMRDENNSKNKKNQRSDGSDHSTPALCRNRLGMQQQPLANQPQHPLFLPP